MAKLMELEVLTPAKSLVLRNDVVYVLLDAVTGGLGILANHEPLIAALKEGPLKIQDEKGNLSVAYIEGGFAEVKDNKVIILTPRAELAEHIDAAHYEQLVQEAHQRLDNPDTLTDIEHTEKILRRANARLHTVELAKTAKPLRV